ncbi:MAG TPA: acyl-CoA dehydrogenase family protein, partial [Turneriella sp.]|nr:acyl-CoA dehydrogenase family protein [Turneriella sp.]
FACVALALLVGLSVMRAPGELLMLVGIILVAMITLWLGNHSFVLGMGLIMLGGGLIWALLNELGLLIARFSAAQVAESRSSRSARRGAKSALGRPAHGLANLIRYILKTSRLHVICGGLGHIARGVLEAEAYTRSREAYGKKLAEFPSVARTLEEMRMLRDALTFISFRAFALADKDEPLSLLLVPLLKTIVTQYSAVVVKEALILHGGNGILGDFSVLPRVLNDAIINETWEGTHALLAEHAVSAAKRPKVAKAFAEYVDAAAALMPAEAQNLLANEFEETNKLLASEFDCDVNRMYICEKLWRIFALAELDRRAQVYPDSSHHRQLLLMQNFVAGHARMPVRMTEN